MTARKTNGTFNRVYGGDPNLVHVEDGNRERLGVLAASDLDAVIRHLARGRKIEDVDAKPLCPGCYMVVVLNMAVSLATANGQSLTELGNTMAQAFKVLGEGGTINWEEIEVILDPEECEEDSVCSAQN